MAASKKKAATIQAKVEEVLRSLGAHENGPHDGRSSHLFKMMTTAGWLNVSPREDNVFCCFDDPKRALAVLGSSQVNPHSGKWNFHGEDYCGYFMEQIVKLALPPQLGHGDQTQLVALPGAWEQVQRHFFTRECGNKGYLAATLTEAGLLLEAWAPGPKKSDNYVAVMTRKLSLVEIPMGIEVMVKECEEALKKPAPTKNPATDDSPSP